MSFSLLKALNERTKYSYLKKICGLKRFKKIMVIFVLMIYGLHMRKLYGSDENGTVALAGLIRHVLDVYKSSISVTPSNLDHPGKPAVNVLEPDQ